MSAQGAINTLTAAQKKDGWQLLFDGKSLANFRGYKTDTVPSAWHTVDGVLTKTVGTGDIVTRKEFKDFDLRFDWKLEKGGNSGAFYRANEAFEHIYWTGPEYQLLDDVRGEDNKTRLTCAGAAYALYPSPAGHLKAVGEWNRARIVARGPHVEHWLNGVKLLEYELWSPDWEAKVKASKFGAWPNYGRATKGHIALQGDHNGALAFRNIKIRELK